MSAFLGSVLLSCALTTGAEAGTGAPETVVVPSGSLRLRALLWRPQGHGPFPAVSFNHGSGRTAEELRRLGRYESLAQLLGPVFARHGYLLLYIFRRGVGLSADGGPSAVERMNRELAAHGEEGRNAMQLRLLEADEMDDALAGLAFLRRRPEVDARRLALVGHSLGGSLTLLVAEREPELRAVVVFGAAGQSWQRSPALRARLLAAVRRSPTPAFFIHAANDYSVEPGRVLDAERQRLGLPHQLRIYPPVGDTPEDGHAFVYSSVPVWEPDLFAFLDRNLGPASPLY